MKKILLPLLVAVCGCGVVGAIAFQNIAKPGSLAAISACENRAARELAEVSWAEVSAYCTRKYGVSISEGTELTSVMYAGDGTVRYEFRNTRRDVIARLFEVKVTRSNGTIVGYARGMSSVAPGQDGFMEVRTFPEITPKNAREFRYELVAVYGPRIPG